MRSLLVALFFVVSCTPAKPQKYPLRQPGCEIQMFADAPTYKTDNIGTVEAHCDDDVSDADCMRQLKDQACKLGADTIWGAPDKPEMDLGKKKVSGRAAHQK